MPQPAGGAIMWTSRGSVLYSTPCVTQLETTGVCLVISKLLAGFKNAVLLLLLLLFFIVYI